MEDLLTAVSTTVTSNRASEQIVATQNNRPNNTGTNICDDTLSPELVFEALKNQPDVAQLRKILSYLNRSAEDASEFNIKRPGPVAAQIINELVGTTLPTFWNTQDQAVRFQLVSCLRSVTGQGAILARLRTLCSVSDSKERRPGSHSSQHMRDLLELLAETLKGDHFIKEIWVFVKEKVQGESKRLVLWKEFVSIIASGRIISVAAQAHEVSSSSSEIQPNLWISNGSGYARWLGRNLVNFASSLGGMRDVQLPKDHQDLAQFASKALSLGYTDALVEAMLQTAIESEKNHVMPLRLLFKSSRTYEKRQYLQLLLRVLDKRYLASISLGHGGDTPEESKRISGVAAFLRGILTEADGTQSDTMLLVDVLASLQSHSTGVVRAALAALSPDADCLTSVLDKAMASFGDQLFIKHTSIMQQEANAQLLLLSAGYVHRLQPIHLFTIARSSIHLNAISNRLSASSPKARFLGMVVGTAISRLVDKVKGQLNFGSEELETPEAEAYLNLTHISDDVGTVEDLIGAPRVDNGAVGKPQVKPKSSEKVRSKVKAASMNVIQEIPQASRITEIEEDEDEGELDDLVPYDKPDSDPEDEDEDPTLVNRHKPTAPVYIRDLITGLCDTENYDRQRLAIQSAPGLIRRKTGFGKELSDRAEELATALIALSDPFEIENFQELRVQAMIALVVAEPRQLGPWFARTFFEGDYSIMQRVSILTALGLAARELGGFKDEDADFTGAKEVRENSFPTKLLPAKYHKLYASEVSSVNAIANKIEQNIIQPLAISAADQATGPDVLKVRTFSSRMEVKKRQKKPAANALAQIVGEAFFFPLTGRWWTHMQAYGARSTSNIHISPLLLVPYLRTLALILHAAGPSSPALPSVTSEFWTLLLSLLQTPALNADADYDVTVLEAVLFSLLTMIDINIEHDSGQRIVQEQAKELLETQGWVDGIFENLKHAGGKDEEGQRVRSLAAGLLVKTHEIVEKYQRSLVGNMMDF